MLLNIFRTAKSIPGWLTFLEIITLYKLLLKYNNEDTIGVEIGSLHGKSSYIISETIGKGTLYCIDPWDNTLTYDKNYTDDEIIFRGKPSKTCYNSIDFFKENTRLQTNIIPIQGYSPSAVSLWWTTPVDFVFLDAYHWNPSDRQNIDFWLPKIKKNGCFIGHDYCDHFPDVKINVKYMELVLGKKVQLLPGTTLWKFDL